MYRKMLIAVGLVCSCAGWSPAAEPKSEPKQEKVVVDLTRANSQNEKPERIKIERDALLERALRGCDWLVDVSQVTDTNDPYYGAMKSEYDTRKKKWAYYEPFWHTGQAVRTLLLAYRASGNKKYLDSALLAGEYMIRRQAMDPSDKKFYGYIYGPKAESLVTAGQVEGFHALYDLYKVTGDKKWLERFHLGADWAARNLYYKDGLFYNGYTAAEDKLTSVGLSRPTNDDAIFWVAYQEFKDPLYKKIFTEVCDRLIRDEDPPGNWMNYQPCKPEAFDGLGRIHPRQTWWWGYPMLTAYDGLGDQKYLDAGIRSAQWYADNNNIDGGYYYNVTRKGDKHLSFDFCTSAVGCAVIMFNDLYKRTGDEKYRKEIEVSLGYLMRAQLNSDVPEDRNVQGAFFESILPPDGTMCPGFYFRDIATVFPVRAILEVMRDIPGDLYYIQY